MGTRAQRCAEAPPLPSFAAASTGFLLVARSRAATSCPSCPRLLQSAGARARWERAVRGQQHLALALNPSAPPVGGRPRLASTCALAVVTCAQREREREREFVRVRRLRGLLRSHVKKGAREEEGKLSWDSMFKRSPAKGGPCVRLCSRSKVPWPLGIQARRLTD